MKALNVGRQVALLGEQGQPQAVPLQAKGKDLKVLLPGLLFQGFQVIQKISFFFEKSPFRHTLRKNEVWVTCEFFSVGARHDSKI